MPFAGFKNFEDCVQQQIGKGHNADSAKKICGFVQKKAEGKMNDWRLLNFYIPIVSEAYKTEEKTGLRIKGIAINETITRNKVKYQAEELEKSVQSLIGKPILKDHRNEIDAIVGRVSNAYFDKNERNIKFEADIEDDMVSNKITKKLISNVSVGAYVKDLNKKEDDDIFVAKGIEFVELSLVAVPADPNAGFSFDMALDNARLLKEAYEMNSQEEASEAVHDADDGKEKCPECGKMIPKGEMKTHMTDMHSKEEKMGDKKMVDEIKDTVQPQPVEQNINVNVDTSKFENLIVEMQKKIDGLSEQLNKKTEDTIKVKEDLTKGKVGLEQPEVKLNNDFTYEALGGSKVDVYMSNEVLAEKYPKLKGRSSNPLVKSL